MFVCVGSVVGDGIPFHTAYASQMLIMFTF